MKLRAVISPILVAAAAVGSVGPYDEPVGDDWQSLRVKCMIVFDDSCRAPKAYSSCVKPE